MDNKKSLKLVAMESLHHSEQTAKSSLAFLTSEFEDDEFSRRFISDLLTSNLAERDKGFVINLFRFFIATKMDYHIQEILNN